MRMPSLKAMGVVATVAIAAGLSLAACGSEEEAPPPKTVPALSAATANRLAAESERIADQIDSGDVCGAAHSADELDAAVSEAEVSAELRAELEVATERLVNAVNCPPPPEPEKKEKEKDKGEDQGEDDESDSGPPAPEGDLPPGLEKKLKEMGDQYEDARLP
jgi:hypothetical protein